MEVQTKDLSFEEAKPSEEIFTAAYHFADGWDSEFGETELSLDITSLKQLTADCIREFYPEYWSEAKGEPTDKLFQITTETYALPRFQSEGEYGTVRWYQHSYVACLTNMQNAYERDHPYDERNLMSPIDVDIEDVSVNDESLSEYVAEAGQSFWDE